MNWFRENRWLGTFLIVCAISALLALYLLFKAKGNFEDASAQFNDAATERNRLEHLDPFPNEANYQQLKVHFENYNAALNRLKDELKTQMRPVEPLAPNEFQSRLRQAITAVTEKARGNRVKLPDNFHVGFDEFTVALPSTVSAPLLGQELAEAEELMNILIDARVDAVTGFQRTSLPPGTTAAASPAARKPAGAANPNVIERNVVDLSFVGAPSAVRKVLNEIGGSSQQFFIIRALHVRNEQEKGPAREQSASAGATGGRAAETAATTGTATGAIKFIVGNEHIQISARVEMVRFAF
jgi:hypothetical protein